MLLGVRHVSDVVIMIFALCCQAFVAQRLAPARWRDTAPLERLLHLSYFFLLTGALLQLLMVCGQVLPPAAQWWRGVALAWGFSMVGAALLAMLLPHPAPPNASRRLFLGTATRTVIAAPMFIAGFGSSIERFQLHLEEVDIRLPRLPKDLDGLRIVQLSDIHLSPFLSPRQLERAIGLANETKAHLAVVTGDLVSYEGDPLDEALRQVAGLKAEAGIWGCHGNHEIYANAEDYATEQGRRLGIRFLRGENEVLRFGGASLNLAGVDYQRFGKDYLRGDERLAVPHATNILLSHNPDVFEAAARKGFHLTLAGHTHGGQVNVEILREHCNIVRFFTPYTRGLYYRDGSAAYVNRGIGTVGIPVRFGSRPEVTLIRLCAT
jgi:predicted MPP superfamily phosphohydrolase